MKRTALFFFSFVLTAVFMCGPGEAVKPGQDVNPNGFPSGLHYNLNIIAKKDGFNCQDMGVPLDENGDPIYGNVVFVPENGQGIEIYIQSGKGQRAAAVTELQVIDPCAAFDGALVQLPKMEAGCRVYARALAKPTGERRIAAVPELVTVQDENGQDLIFLGTLSENGFQTPDGYIYRKKGKSTALNITGMFMWSGSVCSLEVPFEEGLTQTTLCGMDTNDDGIHDVFDFPVEGVCPGGYTPILNAYCKTYTDAAWVFNIAEFVQYLWSIENNGVKLLQVRFYPN